jgi:hypothetical protein
MREEEQEGGDRQAAGAGVREDSFAGEQEDAKGQYDDRTDGRQ